MTNPFPEALKAAHEAATPGPWVVIGSHLTGSHAAQIRCPDGSYPVIKDCLLPLDTDAALIALLRNAVPEILALLEAAQAEYCVNTIVTGAAITRCGMCATCRTLAALVALNASVKP